MGKKLYTAGEFAKKAGVTIRTIRFYDNKGLLKPSSISDAGYRLYTDEDFAKLQRILTLKYLGFSLEDIYMSITNDSCADYLRQSLDSQLQMVKSKIGHMQLIEKSIYEAKKVLDEHNGLEWDKIIDIIHVLNMEKDLVEQYKDSTNVKVRINLHERFGINKKGWFNWLIDNMNISGGESILELGCGNGELWRCSKDKLHQNIKMVLSDISEGMINDAKENLSDINGSLEFQVFDCTHIPFEDESFSIVIANHMLFYLKDREKVLKEIKRVLKKGGYFYCSTYGSEHMKQIEQLTKAFDSRIALSEVNLWEIFGLENGEAQLQPWFTVIFTGIL